jgi:hypothetical protein
MGLVWLAVRDARRRRTAEAELERLNAELARRVELRTATLRVRTRELHDSRLRERLREKESEVAFQAGQVQAAGAYLHGVGNALSALEVELLRLTKTLDQARRVEDVFDTLAKSLEAGNRQETDRLLAALREVVLVRGFERLTGSLAALTDIKIRMADELERRRGEFERSGPPTPYLQTFRVDLELAAVLDAPAPGRGQRSGGPRYRQGRDRQQPQASYLTGWPACCARPWYAAHAAWWSGCARRRSGPW